MSKTRNDHIRSYAGRKSVYGRVQKMIDQAGGELRIMTTENGIVRMYKIRERTYRQAIERGVILRIALPISKANLYYVDEFVRMGAQIRHLPESARNRFVHVDGGQIMAHLTSQDDTELQADDDYGVWTDMPEFVELTGKFFDNLWEKLSTHHERRLQIKFGLRLRLLVVALYFVIIAGVIRLMLAMSMSDYLTAVLCGLAAIVLYALGANGLRFLVGRSKLK